MARRQAARPGARARPEARSVFGAVVGGAGPVRSGLGALASGHLALGDPGGLAAAIAQVIELGPAHDAAALDLP